MGRRLLQEEAQTAVQPVGGAIAILSNPIHLAEEPLLPCPSLDPNQEIGTPLEQLRVDCAFVPFACPPTDQSGDGPPPISAVLS